MGIALWEAILLGVVQGLTEWLPVSSSAHLVIAQEALGIEDPVAFDLWLHFGTLVAVLAVYGRRLVALAAAVVRVVAFRSQRQEDLDDARLAGLLVVATVPAALFGLLFRRQVEASFSSLWVTGAGLVVTGVALVSTRWARIRRDELGAAGAIVVGAAQATSLLSGISRSGATMAAALHLGLDARRAADFSFLLSVPVLIGAGILQAPALKELPELGWTVLVAGFVTSTLVGYAAIRWLLALVKRWPLAVFGPYCIVVGAVLVVVGLR